MQLCKFTSFDAKHDVQWKKRTKYWIEEKRYGRVSIHKGNGDRIEKWTVASGSIRFDSMRLDKSCTRYRMNAVHKLCYKINMNQQNKDRCALCRWESACICVCIGRRAKVMPIFSPCLLFVHVILHWQMTLLNEHIVIRIAHRWSEKLAAKIQFHIIRFASTKYAIGLSSNYFRSSINGLRVYRFAVIWHGTNKRTAIKAVFKEI